MLEQLSLAGAGRAKAVLVLKARNVLRQKMICILLDQERITREKQKKRGMLFGLCFE
jgi:hypothetical protein